MNSGFVTEGSKNLKFSAVDRRTEVYEELFGVKRVVVTGMEISELADTHVIKVSVVEMELAHEADCKWQREYSSSTTTYGNLECFFVDFACHKQSFSGYIYRASLFFHNFF